MGGGLFAGYNSKEKKALSSPFDIAGSLKETILMSNLAIGSYDIRRPSIKNTKNFDYPGKGIKLLWDGPNMKVTNFEEANQFVKRNYREGWNLGM